MFKFVHASDLHLDSPFKGISGESDAVAEVLRSATFAAFASLIKLAIEHRVDFVLIAGDVYDGADRSLRAQLRFRDGLTELSNRGIRSFVVHGNHDPSDGWTSAMDWPDGVHIFKADEVETVTVSRDGYDLATVSGISFRTRRENRRLAGEFRRSESGLFNIGLLHCNCGGNTGHEDYSPCRVEDLTQVGMDYWALGHVHARGILHEVPHIVYPGNAQGLSIRETGPRGCYLVTVDDSGAVGLEFRELDAVRWLTAEVSIAGMQTLDALDRAVSKVVDDLREQGGGRPVVCRIRLSGRGPLYQDLTRCGAMAGLLERLRLTGLGNDPLVWVQAVESGVRPDIDLEQRRRADDFLGQVLRVAGRIREAPDFAAKLSPALSDLYEHVRVGKAIDRPPDDDLRRLLEEAELLCVDLLEGEE